jgi:hypothetical protein
MAQSFDPSKLLLAGSAFPLAPSGRRRAHNAIWGSDLQRLRQRHPGLPCRQFSRFDNHDVRS